ncbi:MAG: hypothetical protein AB7R55_20485 [Gemmatimonadales bacterium]
MASAFFARLAAHLAAGDGAFSGDGLPSAPAPLIRTWRGVTRTEDAVRYLDYVERTGLADYASGAGHLGALALNRPVAGGMELLIVSGWASEAALARFAGGDLERARFYPEDDAFLIDRDCRAVHYRLARAIARR